MIAGAGVYAIRHRVSGRVYIGSSVTIARRWAQHRKLLLGGRHHSPKLQELWSQDGADAFEFVMLLRCAPTKDAVLFYEDRALRAFDAVKTGFNVAPKAGSRLGVPHGPVAKAKISASLVGHKRSLGKRHSAETKRKMSAAHKGAIQPPWTPEQRERYEASRKSPVFLARLSAALKGNKNSLGRKQSPETIAAMQAGRSRLRDEVRAARARSQS